MRTLNDVWITLDPATQQQVKRINVYQHSSDGSVVAEFLNGDQDSLTKEVLAPKWSDRTPADLDQQSIDLAGASLPSQLTPYWVGPDSLVIRVQLARDPAGGTAPEREPSVRATRVTLPGTITDSTVHHGRCRRALTRDVTRAQLGFDPPVR